MKDSAPARPSLRQIQYFVAVADHGAFGAAALTLGVSQPGLSRQLAAMEADLGALLFERTSRSVRLTAAGEALLPRARRVLQEVRELHVVARGSGGLFGDRLAIGVLPSIGAYFMPAASRLLHRLYPDLRLLVREGSTVRLRGMLKESALDVVVGTATRDPEFRAIPLFAETLWICAASDDPLSSSQTPVTLHDLRDKPLLSLSPGFRLSRIIERLADAAGTYVNRDYEGASLDAVRQMAVMGAGVAVLPSLYALAEAVRDPDLVVRRIDHPEAVHDIALLFRRTSPFEDDCKRLAAHLIDVKQSIRAARPERFS